MYIHTYIREEKERGQINDVERSLFTKHSALVTEEKELMVRKNDGDAATNILPFFAALYLRIQAPRKIRGSK